MAPEHQRLSPDERSNLVAFLDGELPEVQAQVIATKLTQSVTARREADLLQRTWELLDFLPRPHASPNFTLRTLAEAESFDGRGNRMALAASDFGRKVISGIGCLAAAVVLFGFGYLFTAQLWPNPSARLATDLSIAESLEAYREVGGIEFLRQIDAAPEFY